ncbi:MAG: VOC family protein [Nocardioidaceae bacterium]
MAVPARLQYWEIHVIAKEGDAAGDQRGRLRFGVSDIAAERDSVVGLGIDVDEIGQSDGLVRWCDFEDPWGNRLGLYQDLSRWPAD